VAKGRFTGDEPHMVPELSDCLIEPDEIVTVPDDRFDAYLLNPDLWEPVEEPKTPPPAEEPPATPAVKKAAAKTPKGSDD